MRSITLALVSTLLLSPVSVLSTYHEESHSPYHREYTVTPTNDETRSQTINIKIQIENHGMLVHQTCKVKEDKTPCFRSHSCNEAKNICSGQYTKGYGFRCHKKFYKHKKIISSAKEACKRLKKNSDHHKFPALYTASEYSEPGPYWEYPFNKNFLHLGSKKNRLIMTSDCTVVGAVIRKKDSSYTQCRYGPRKEKKH